MSLRSRLAHHRRSGWLVAAAALGLVVTAAAPAIGQPIPPPPIGGPGQIPTRQPFTMVRGVVDLYLVNPNGEIDGILLSDQTVVRFSPHVGMEVADVAKPRDPVVINGFSWIPKTVQATTIENERNRRSVTDRPPAPGSPPPPTPTPPPKQPMRASGDIKALTHAESGDIDGAVLTDGTVVHFPPYVGTQFATLLWSGLPLAASGYGVSTRYGRSLEATAIGTSLDRLQPANPPPPPGTPSPSPPR